MNNIIIKSKPTEIKSEPIEIKSKPTEIKSESTEIKSEPTEIKSEPIEQEKLDIIELFRKNIKGKKIELENYDKKHNGKEGHWLEKQMNIKHNSKNEPDINGYEMKKESKKITFVDAVASEYLFSKDKKYINKKNGWDDNLVNISKEQFIKFFGTQKPQKHNKYSWSGECIPTYNNWNTCGQNLIITDNNDICIFYSYSEDKRDEIKSKFPEYLKKENVLIVVWTNEKMRKHINTKFNNKGFFIIKKKDNIYNKICFGKSFNYEYFIDGIKKTNIFFDSGMSIKEKRMRSPFRSSSNKFWNELIVEEYE
jgi:hypothetical protein